MIIYPQDINNMTKNTFDEDMAQLIPSTIEAWQEYQSRNADKRAEREKEEYE